MNIFILDEDPEIIAQYHCDVHVVKMIVETAQLLSTAHHILNDKEAISGIYKKTHKNHPCAIWVRESRENYNWTHYLLGCLLIEYTYRYNKIHKTQNIWKNLYQFPKNIESKQFNLNSAPQCMPDEHKMSCVIEAYRKYYKNDKTKMSRFTYKKREIPNWLLT